MKCLTCSRSLPLIFSLHWRPLAWHFSFCHRPYKLFLLFWTKKCLLCFLSLALNSCRPFSRWASLAYRPLSLFLCLSLALYSKLVDMDNLSKLNTLGNTDTETISASVLVFIDSFVVSALQDASGYAISRQNNLELHLGYHTCWLSYFILVCLWCGQTVSRASGRSVYGHVITKFSRMGRLLHFLTHGAPLARFARESSAKSVWIIYLT